MEEIEDDNWLNNHLINCPNCKEELQICDHSPFDDGYILYCDSCPKRVDVSVYEKPLQNKIFDAIEKHEDAILYIERRINPCNCGGKFKLTAKKRCLHCNFELDLKEEQNVWLKEYWGEFKTNEEAQIIEEKMMSFIVNPNWKASANTAHQNNT